MDGFAQCKLRQGNRFPLGMKYKRFLAVNPQTIHTIYKCHQIVSLAVAQFKLSIYKWALVVGKPFWADHLLEFPTLYTIIRLSLWPSSPFATSPIEFTLQQTSFCFQGIFVQTTTKQKKMLTYFFFNCKMQRLKLLQSNTAEPDLTTKYKQNEKNNFEAHFGVRIC